MAAVDVAKNVGKGEGYLVELPQVRLECLHDAVREALKATNAKRLRDGLLPRTIEVGRAVAAGTAQPVLGAVVGCPVDRTWDDAGIGDHYGGRVWHVVG